MASSTSRAAAVTGTMRGPVLVSLNLNSPAVRSTSSQRRFSISLLRHPVSINNLIAATAGGQVVPSASCKTRPRRRYSSGVRNRSQGRIL